MKKLFGGAAACLAGALILSPLAPASAIVDGDPDGGEHPYVGQLLFYVPDAQDPRFDDPGGWYNCTGTLIDEDTVVTAGHCTYGTGTDGVSVDPMSGGNDVWFSVAEQTKYPMENGSAHYAPEHNEDRYEDWSEALDDSGDWARVSSTHTHPDYVDSAFLLHDLGVLELEDKIVLGEYGSLPEENYLDTYYSKKAKQRGLFESVGYGLEGSGPKWSFGGDTRRKADRKLVSFKGAYGYKNIAVKFSHNDGGTCFGDSGGPTFDITTDALDAQNIIVAVTSFGLNYNCNASGSYRLDQPDDIAFLQRFYDYTD